MIRRRRRAKQATVVVALLGCYLAGVASTRAWRAATPRGAEPIAQEDVHRDKAPAPVAPKVAEQPIVPPMPVVAIERQPTFTEEPSFDTLRQFSDRCLQREQDVALALRYYTRALNRASAEEEAISTEHDSWLLMALKASRIKETQDERGT
jgi:hypothetical protein